jgi:hypothetical protein
MHLPTPQGTDGHHKQRSLQQVLQSSTEQNRTKHADSSFTSKFNFLSVCLIFMQP